MQLTTFLSLVGLLLPIIVAWPVYGVLRLWFLGSIFSRWRAKFEARKDKLDELMTCPLCMSFWLSLIVSAIYLIVLHCLEPAPLWFLPVLWAMVTCAAVTVVSFIIDLMPLQ